MSVFDAIFQPIYGKMCWNVKNGIGSFLTFEFGEPHIKVAREPFVSKSQNPNARRHASRRVVSIYGDWMLWIRDCDWQFYQHDLLLGDSESKKRDLKQIAFDLEGQALRKVLASSVGITVFEFDLGGRLETRPYIQTNLETELDEQWSLFEPSGMVFTLRSDGKFNHAPASQPKNNEWISINEYSE